MKLRSCNRLKRVETLTNQILLSDCFAVEYCRRRLLDEIATVLEYDFAAYLKESATGPQFRANFRAIEVWDMPLERTVSIIRATRICLLQISFIKHARALNLLKSASVLAMEHFRSLIRTLGVTHEFFRRLFATGEVDLCFGNQGLLNDSVRRNIHVPQWRKRKCQPRQLWEEPCQVVRKGREWSSGY